MAKFLVSSEVAELLPRMQVVVVVAKGLDNHGPNAAVSAHVEKVITNTLANFSSQGYANVQSHPRIALYRDTLKTVASVSAKKYPQSHESLLKRILKEQKGPRPISPVVDFYNSVSVEHVVTAGAFDLDELQAAADQAPLELRVARVDQDAFVPLDTPDAPPGKVDNKEILYAQGKTVVTRHLAWRQSRQALVTEESRNVVFVSEVLLEGKGPLEGMPSDLARAVAESLETGLKELFGVADCAVNFLGKSLGKLEVEL